jgi:hypothetical protein
MHLGKQCLASASLAVKLFEKVGASTGYNIYFHFIRVLFGLHPFFLSRALDVTLSIEEINPFATILILAII